MTVIEVKVPELSESVAEGTVMQWLKKSGDNVTADEILVEVETDKVVLEVPAPASGRLTDILVSDGAKVISAQVIARIDTQIVKAVNNKQAPPPALNELVVEKVSKADVAMPSAAKLLAENQMNVTEISGTGKDGRVTKGDVLNTLAQKTQEQARDSFTQIAQTNNALNVPLEERLERREPMSRLRASIARRLLESQQTTASLTTFNEVNMAPVMSLRQKYQDIFTKKYGVKLGFMSFFVKAAVHALKMFPIVNASIDGEDLVFHHYYDIGVAISSPRGLVVPILRDADQLSFAEIELKIAEFAQKAKDGKLSMAELSGGTFSITNGGVFGSMLSTPIINPPQSAILGIHATKDRPVVENGEIVIRPICYLALSYDHRLIDGRDSVQTLVAMKDALEDPARMLIDL